MRCMHKQVHLKVETIAPDGTDGFSDGMIMYLELGIELKQLTL